MGYAKDYGFLSFAKDTGKNLSSKYRQAIPDSTKKSATDVLKTASKRAIQKTEEATGDLIANEIVEKRAGLTWFTEYCKQSLHEQRQGRLLKLIYRDRIEYRKIINLLKNTTNRPSKFNHQNQPSIWVEVNDCARGSYNVNSQIKFKTTMLK